MDYIVHGIAKSQIQLSNFHFHFTHQGRETVIETLAYCVHPLPGKVIDLLFLSPP